MGIALSKGAAAFWTGSGAMLAETVHSLADCANQLLLLLGLKLSRRPPSEEYPLGHGRAVYFWSFVVALLLFAVGGMFSVYEGVHKLRDPEPLRTPWIAIGVLAVSVGLEAFSLWGALREIRKVSRGKSLLRYFHESREAELIVVLGEDVAALAGLVMALAAVIATLFTGNPVFDAAGSIGIGALLIVVALALSYELYALLIGQSAESGRREEIRAWLAARPEVAEVLHLITLHMGNDVMVAVKAHMRQRGPADRLVADINAVEAGLKTRFPQVRWTFFEPDVKD
jgi:cation diffusion facilitator family transporter